MIANLRLRAQSSDWRQHIEFVLVDLMPETEGIAYGESVNMVTHKVDGIAYEPTFSLLPQQAQILMDDLWNCGLRPTEGVGSVGQLKATQNHLEDMRTLVFEKMRIEE